MRTLNLKYFHRYEALSVIGLWDTTYIYRVTNEINHSNEIHIINLKAMYDLDNIKKMLIMIYDILCEINVIYYEVYE